MQNTLLTSRIVAFAATLILSNPTQKAPGQDSLGAPQRTIQLSDASGQDGQGTLSAIEIESVSPPTIDNYLEPGIVEPGTFNQGIGFEDGINFQDAGEPGLLEHGLLEPSLLEYGVFEYGAADEGVITTSEDVVTIDVSASDGPVVHFGDWLGYNPTQHDTTWLAGTGDDFGMFSMESHPTLEVGKDSNLMIGTGIHFLNGPIVTDMPPRLFDFQLAYQSRKPYNERLILDTKFSVGAFSDFEGSARKGVRFPGHLVGYYQWHPWLVSVLGVEYFDRDDIGLLPVAGIVWRPRKNLVAEIVFPRPKLQVKISERSAMYLSGELGGGTWAIERSSDVNDNATYRDLRLMFGIMNFAADKDDSAIEIGWAFARAIEYRSSVGNYHPDDAFILRFRQHY